MTTLSDELRAIAEGRDPGRGSAPTFALVLNEAADELDQRDRDPSILADVLRAMQRAEEIGGPNLPDYVRLMAAISAEATKRIEAAVAHHGYNGELPDTGLFAGGPMRAMTEGEQAACDDLLPAEDGCTNPGGHEWNRSAGEADEARLSGDYENDNIRCIHCGADGDA